MVHAWQNQQSRQVCDVHGKTDRQATPLRRTVAQIALVVRGWLHMIKTARCMQQQANVKAFDSRIVPVLQDRYEQVVLNMLIKPSTPIVSCLTPLTGCA